MPSISLTPDTISGFKMRFEALRADSERKFGTLDPAGMMRHMRNVMETGLGEVSYPDQSKPIVSKLMLFITTRIITTWPGGKIKAPDFWTPPAEEDFEKERELLIASMERFAEKAAQEPSTVVTNPFFGAMTLAQWALLDGIHLHHHLRQFGC